LRDFFNSFEIIFLSFLVMCLGKYLIGTFILF